MSLIVYPSIREDDFPQLQHIVADLKGMTYAEWTYARVNATAPSSPSSRVARIPVTPWAFAQWLEVTQQTAHLDLLWCYAEAIAGISRPKTNPAPAVRQPTETA